MSTRILCQWFSSFLLGMLAIFQARSADSLSFPLSHDETVVLFPTDASFDELTTQWQLPIHGWVYQANQSVVRKNAAATILESKFELSLDADNERYFSERVSLLFADNERGKAFWIRLCDKDFHLTPSEPNGHFCTSLIISNDVVAQCQEKGALSFYLHTAPEDHRQFHGRVRLLAPHGVSLISDIDDTVKITEVTHRKQLLDNTFYQAFRAIDGMPAAYQRIAEMDVQFHFVSSSPWQLYPVLEAFREAVDLPVASYSLKDIRFRDSDFFNLFKSGEKTKPQQIAALLQRFPQRQFILIGDSGEQDPEVYAMMLRQYPQQILGFAIRAVDGTDQQARYDQLFQNLGSGSVMVFQDPRHLPHFVASLLQQQKPLISKGE